MSIPLLWKYEQVGPENDPRDGTPPLQGQAERVQPGEKKVLR